jgi:two-component system, chemotaxis family, chemotaxis protein CheY
MNMAATAPVKRRAIVVDDSRAMRTILRRALEERGFSVTEAVHGKEALDKLGQMRIPHLALVDWNMPEMNGIDLVAALRSDPNYDKLAIVMVTSESEPAQVERALTMGANEYIMKPFSNDALEEKLLMLGLSGGNT